MTDHDPPDDNAPELRVVTWLPGQFPGGHATVSEMTWAQGDRFDTGLVQTVEQVQVARVLIQYTDGEVRSYEKHPDREADHG